jgi:hypothetical protein
MQSDTNFRFITVCCLGHDVIDISVRQYDKRNCMVGIAEHRHIHLLIDASYFETVTPVYQTSAWRPTFFVIFVRSSWRIQGLLTKLCHERFFPHLLTIILSLDAM